MPSEEVRLTGSRRIDQFVPVSNKSVLERLNPAARSKVLVADLAENGVENFGKVAATGEQLEVFFQNQPMQLALWPNSGFAKIIDVVGDTPINAHGIAGSKEGWFTYDGERPSRWEDEPDAWLHGYWFWDWSDSFEKIDSIEKSTKTIRLKPPYHNYGYRKNQRYYA